MSNFASSTPTSKNVDSEKLLHEWELNLLLGNVKKSIELWFLTRNNSAVIVSYEQIMAACVEVLKHDFMPNQTLSLNKLHDDYEWLRRSAQIRDFQFIKSSNNDNKITNKSKTTTATTTTTGVTSDVAQEFLENWTLFNLRGNCLCAALQTFMCEKDLLEFYYPRTTAFMRHESYATAFLICLSALELNQYSLLSQIDAKLYAPPVRLINENIMHRHRRTNSHPNFSISPPKQHENMLNEKHKQNSNEIDGKTAIRKTTTFRKIKSLPEFHTSTTSVTTSNVDTLPRRRSKTLGAVHRIKFHKNNSNNEKISTSLTQKEIQAIKTTITTRNHNNENNKLQSASNSTLDIMSIPSNTSNLSCSSSSNSISSYTTARRVHIINCDDIKIWTDQNWEMEKNQQSKKAQQNITPPCNIPHDSKNTSPIQSFLSNIFGTTSSYSSCSEKASCSQSSINDLTVCEANPNENVTNPSNIQNNNTCNKNITDCHNYVEPVTTTIGNVFDAFMPIYGKKLRAHNSQSLFETGISYLDYSQPSSSNRVEAPASVAAPAVENVSTNERTSTVAGKNCESLTAFLQMSKLSRNNTALEKENAHFRISEAIISAVEHIKWTKLQAGQTAKQPVKEVEEHIPFAEVNGVEEFADQHSAEVVGLTLLSKFNDKQLPKVSELKWLVSEEDAPQQLLPLPDQITNNPDDNFVRSLTRGTRYWAPPRPQIIFTDHPPPNRKQLVQKQNNRCAGCGMVVSAQYVHSFRYCTYLGKYHCTGCHRNQMSATPAKILQNWDFKCYPVSVFAYRLLEQMYACPLFHVPDLNSTLYEKQPSLQKARFKRLQLHYVRDFINTCRFAVREQQYFETLPTYLTAELDLWSLSDLTDAYNKIMQRSIDDLIERCENHIFHCVLCTARGFLCEHCQKDEIIYPWQNRVHRCDYCGACFHKKCWTSGMSAQCLRCQRLQNRTPEDNTKN